MHVVICNCPCVCCEPESSCVCLLACCCCVCACVETQSVAFLASSSALPCIAHLFAWCHFFVALSFLWSTCVSSQHAPVLAPVGCAFRSCTTHKCLFSVKPMYRQPSSIVSVFVCVFPGGLNLRSRIRPVTPNPRLFARLHICIFRIDKFSDFCHFLLLFSLSSSFLICFSLRRNRRDPNLRTRIHPVTPNPRVSLSKRSWDGQVRKWRSLLHFWDIQPDPEEKVGQGIG